MARQIAKDYDEKRRLILNKAAQLFADDGFDRTSVSNIASACGISKANIYHYYTSKDQILFDILDTYLKQLRDRICHQELTHGDAVGNLKRTVIEILMAYQGSDNEHRLQAGRISHLSKDQRHVLIGYQRDLVTYMSARLSEVAPEVFTENSKKLRPATMSIFGMLNWFYMWSPGADQKQRMNYAEVVCSIALDGLAGLKE